MHHDNEDKCIGLHFYKITDRFESTKFFSRKEKIQEIAVNNENFERL